MSRATWYRYGKPAPGKVPHKVTMKKAERTTERYMKGGADNEISLVAFAKDGAAREAQMLGIRDWLEIRRLDKSRAWTSKQYHIEIEALKKAGASRDKIDQRQDDARFEDKTYEDQIEYIRTRDLLKQASHYNLPLPSRDDEEAWEPNWRYLYPAHFANLRTAIREERKVRREQILAWLSALTGIGGVIVAIVALLNK